MLGLRHSGGGEGAPHRGLVARRGRGLRRVAGEPQPLGQAAAAHPLVVDGTTASSGLSSASAAIASAAASGRTGRASTWLSPIDEPPLGRHHDLGAERPGGGEEVGRPVAGRRQQEEQASRAGIVGPGR